MKARVKRDDVIKLLGTRKALFIILLAFIPMIQPERPVMGYIDPPYDGCGFAFDEAYYVTAVRKMLYYGEVTNLEHPPFTKSLMALGIAVFDDNPWSGEASTWPAHPLPSYWPNS